MAGLTGKTVATTYHSLLKVSSTDNQNFDTTLRDIVDGEDTASCLKLATDKATVTLGTDAGDDFLVTGSSASNALVVEGESGQVGIGISAPTDLLHVYRNDSSTASMLKLENDGTGDVTMQFLTTSDTAWSIGQDNSHSANAFVIAASAVLETTPIATFQQNGNVGIGTASPTQLLEIASTTTLAGLKISTSSNSDSLIHFLNTHTANDCWTIGNDNSNSDSFNIAYKADTTASLSSESVLTILQSGSVGIGTASPAFQLELEGSAASEMSLTRTGVLSNDDEIGAYTFTTIADTVAKLAAHRESSTSNAYMAFYTEATSESMTEKMRITSTGNVGIGCADPGAISTQVSSTVLEVRGTVTSATSGFTGAGELRLSSASTDVGDGDVLGVISFQAAKDDTGTDSFLPSAAIWCEGDGTFDADYNGGEIVFATANSENAIATAQERMRIGETGNVGIGTIAPTVALHVNDAGLTDATAVLIKVTGTGNSVENEGGIGVIYENGSDTNAPTAFLRLDASDGAAAYYFQGDDGNLYSTTATTNIGIDGSSSIVSGQSSDERLKDISKNIFPYGLSEINQLAPIQFTYKADKKKKSWIGFGAQTTKSIIPESVTVTRDCIDGYTKEAETGASIPKSNNTDYKHVMQYVQIIPVLVKAIQELSAKVTALENA